MLQKKTGKFNPQDFEESKLWNKYMIAYEDALNSCNHIPWHIVPADQNWYKEYLVASVVVDYLKSLKMTYPKIKKTK